MDTENSGGEPPRPDEQIGQFLQKLLNARSLPILIFGAAIALWLASGLFIVSPGEQGVVRQFGKYVRLVSAGLNWHVPWPVEQANIVNVEQVRRAEIGLKGRDAEASFQRGTAVSRSEAMMLTGDENIIQAQIIVMYKIKDPVQYLFRILDPERTLFTATEVALRSAVGKQTIDDVLTIGRLQVQEETREFLQRLMDDYESGIAVVEVKLQVVDPPDQVKDAFHEVVRAREDRERLINEARGYQEDIVPRARGEGQKMIRGAEGYKEERILMARGDASRFKAVLAEYQKAKEVTWNRLQLETLDRILPQASKLIVDSKTNSHPLPLIPLEGFNLFKGPAEKNELKLRTPEGRVA